MEKRVVVTYSGGIDSSTLLFWLRNEGYEVCAIGVDYGQRHRKELLAAESICRTLGVEYRLADLRPLTDLFQGSALTDDTVEVPEGHYAADSMKATVVPNRNMLLIATATAWAISQKIGIVAYGAHAGDHTIYPDCRPEFVNALGQAVALCDWSDIELLAPFVNKTKAEIVSVGAKLEVPFSDTWSCYKGGELHCGQCGTCVERREAFELAEVEDPTAYSSTSLL